MKNSQALLSAQQLTIGHVGKVQPVIHDVNFDIQQGEIITLLGPSGVGKSTLLSTLAGLHLPEKGQIELLGKPITQQKSEMAFMFQNAVLLPWLNIAENVAFGQNFKNQPQQTEEEIQMRVSNALQRVKLEHLPQQAKPNTLSGGMAQRVALARALAKSPRLLLLDEPFSALDELNRAQLQRLLVDLVHSEEIGVAIMITHDIDEALLISDRIFFLSGQPAKISQIWTVTQTHPRDIWESEFSMIRNDILKLLYQHQAKMLEDSEGNRNV